MARQAGCERACAPCRGPECGRYGKGASLGDAPIAVSVRVPDDGKRDVVQETVDAVSGATWGTRNMIMEGLFRQDMADHGDSMPKFKPPGT